MDNNSNKKVLCLDFDDVILRTTPIIESIIEKINYNASGNYVDNLNLKEREGIIDRQTHRTLVEESFDLKDQILEEVYPRYKGRIDYSKIITIDNAYQNVIDYINYLCQCGRYDKVYIISHYNVEREIECKSKFIKKYLPYAELIPVKFHLEPYKKGIRRECTNKALYVKRYLKIKGIKNYTLVDNSLENVCKWEKAGGIGIQYNEHIYCHSKVHDLNPFNIMAVEGNKSTKLTDGKTR